MELSGESNHSTTLRTSGGTFYSEHCTATFSYTGQKGPLLIVNSPNARNVH